MEVLDGFVETAATEVDLTPVLDSLNQMYLQNGMQLALLAFFGGLLLVLIFTGGWGNG